MNSVANRERSRMADNKSVTQQDVDAITKAERGGLRQLFAAGAGRHRALGLA